MTEVNIDKETGLVKPAVYTCYQDENYLCRLKRISEDSKMSCAFKVKGCCYAVKRGEK